MRLPKIVLDTNVLVAALRSRRGASFSLLSWIGTGRFEISLSVPLVLEYEDALLRQPQESGINHDDVSAVLDYLCTVGRHQSIFFLWRPLLRDPKDDLVLELAVAGGCHAIITHNLRDFAGTERFGVRALTPREFLNEIGEGL